MYVRKQKINMNKREANQEHIYFEKPSKNEVESMSWEKNWVTEAEKA